MVAQSFTKKIPLYNTKLNEHGSHAPNWLNWPVANPATLDNLYAYTKGEEGLVHLMISHDDVTKRVACDKKGCGHLAVSALARAT